METRIAQTKVAMLAGLGQLIDDGAFRTAMNELGKLDETTFSSDSPAVYAGYLSRKALILFGVAQYQSALTAAEKGLELIKGSDENALIAELQSTVARTYTELGRIDDAERAYRDLIATYRRIDNIAGVIRSLNRLARTFFMRGQYDRSIECLLEGQEYAQADGNRKMLAMIAGNLGTIFNLTGEFHKSLEYLEQSVAENQRLGNELNLCRAKLSVAFAQMHLKEFAAAEKSLEEAESIVANSDYHAERQTLNQYRAQYHQLRQNYRMSFDFAQMALTIATEQAQVSASVCQSQRLLAEVQLQLGNRPAALKSARSALAVAEKIDERVEAAACHRLLGQVSYKSGKFNDAENEFGIAVRQLTKCGAQFELARTWLVWSRSSTDRRSISRAAENALNLLEGLRLAPLYIHSAATLSSSKTTEVPLIGKSQGFTSVVAQAMNCASGDIPVLLLGQTGSGKDQFARFIHHSSGRDGKPFVQVNCAAIPSELAESEFFGYEKGAFTNANERRRGFLKAADGGTLFLNEIGELPLNIQVKLLAALEEKKFYPLGCRTQVSTDFRLMAATNMDLEQAVREGRFRSDLYFRLAVLTLELPRLAERGDDSYLLFEHFVAGERMSLDRVDSRTLESLRRALRTYDWPGNVRELRNYIDLYSVTKSRDIQAICRQLIQKFTSGATFDSQELSLRRQVDVFEASKIRTALVNCGGIIRRTAASLGVPEATLRSKMKKHQISAA